MAQELFLPEDDLAQKAGALRIISLGVTAAVVVGEIMAIIVWLIDRSFPIITATIIETLLLFISLFSYWLVKVKHSRLAGYFFVISFSLEAAVITLLFGGATGPISVLYIFPIMVSGIVLGVNYSYLAATLVTVLYLAMIPVEQTDIVIPILGMSEEATIIPAFVGMWVIFFYLVAFLSWFASSRLNQSLQDTRHYATELQETNEKLQSSEEELRSANEELQASEEELRASNEELQTSNEELKEAQEKLVRSEKLAAIGQLSGGVGHELRNPLGAIKNAIYYVKGKLLKSELAEKEPRVVEFLNIMDEEINSSNKIINDLLSFSRTGKPTVSKTQIPALVENALSHTPIPSSIELIKKLDSNLSEIDVDSDQIRQVLVNITTNAVQAMPEGGRLTIGATTENGSLQLKITDTGVGISEDTIGKIFDPLYTMKAKGIGLGLALCKSIVERHEGSIKAESELGKGTTVTVTLPLNS